MKSAIQTCTLLFVMGCSAGSSVAAACTWDACLTQAAAACECLSERIRSCNAGACSNELIPTSVETARLAARITRGARYETSLAFDTLRVLDGGNLEDVMRALANLTTDDPELLLEQLQANGWDAARIESLVRMLPLETVDRPDERLRLIRQRIASLQRVHDKEVESLRAVAIVSLRTYEAQLSHK